ncbi:MAG: hypothetical protein NZ483_05875 [Verrucomicrobiae bacterium]|nr:hypothetical protein [Verrucomicrobiae bacterium]
MLRVCAQPGNNYRVAATCCAGELGRLTVTNGVPGLVYVPAGNEGTLEGFQGRLSEMVTVWRRLHVELDSMAAVTNNFVSGLITNISGGTTIATGFWVNQNLADGSPLLPGGDGRFQNGWIRVGVGAGQTNLWVEANGTNFVRNLVTGFYVPFRITKGGRPPVTGNVRAMERGVQSVRVYLHVTGGQLSGAYKDGTLEVAGVATNIVAVNAGQSLVTVPLGYALPFVLHDDDDDGLLPQMPDASLLTNALAQAYIVPVFDLSNPTPMVPFVGNVSFDSSDPIYFGPSGLVGVQRWDSKSLNQPDYWVVYLLTCFQGDVLEDADPLDEVGEDITVGITAVPDGGSLVFEEHLRELAPANPAVRMYERRITVVHELGHAMTGATNEPVTTCDQVLPPCSPTYKPLYLDLIRTSPRPISQP